MQFSIDRTSVPRAARRGVLLIEILLGIAVFALFVSAVGLTLLRGQEGTEASGDRVRGTEYAEKALEAARSIRDQDFSLLTAGQHGIQVDGIGRWQFAGTQSTFSGGYTVSLTITPIAQDEVVAMAVASWNRSPNRPQSVRLQTVLTEHSATKTVGNWSAFTLSGSYAVGSQYANPVLNDIALGQGHYAYVGANSLTQSLFIFDVASPPALPPPLPVNLGVSVYASAVKGTMLYAVTSDPNGEIKAFDITNPTSPIFVTSYDLPGNGNATSLVVDGDFLFVGAKGLGPAAFLPHSPPPIAFAPLAYGPLALANAIADHAYARAYCLTVDCLDSCVPAGMACTQDADCCGTPCILNTCDFLSSSAASSSSSSASSAAASSSGPYPNGNDFFSFDISNPTVIRYLHSLYVGGVNWIHIAGNAAYIASTVDTAELRVVNIANPAALAFAPGSVNGAPQGGYDLTDRTLDGTAITTTGTNAILGTQQDSPPLTPSIVLFDASTGGVPTTNGPWLYSASGNVMRVDADASGCYAFIATDWRSQALQVIKIKDHSMAKLLTYAIAPPVQRTGRALVYDPALDRLYLIDHWTLYIFTPAAGPSSCP
ncbi:hypothetical protein HYR82_03415 [Candidatus Peregrinibacteria bacterium]|nr:hypothetical protein [Candidatus Peregrinibacteria bacterium]